ncbi:MAG: MarR family transcriptional regulator [Bacteroidetes bacterium]|nr:MarR family transcriptional regulator [Bacteroidota bacterium]
MKYELLQALIPLLEEYERSYPQQQQLQHFAVWLARQTASEEQIGHKNSQDSGNEAATIQTRILFLSRYARAYAKKALEHSPLGSIDEYAYLELVAKTNGLTKSDLIYRNRHEKPTGMEIIRRLQASGLIEQTDDPDDKRSKQLHLTETGRQTLEAHAAQMDHVAFLLSANLNGAEKLLLLQILEKLEIFHQLLQAKVKGGDSSVFELPKQE